MKAYKVMHLVEGEYIGNGLYREYPHVMTIYASQKKAEDEAKRLKKELGGTYYVVEAEVIE